MFRLGLKESPTCWRCNQEEGSLVHTVWFCKRIQEFWVKIHRILSAITQISIPYRPGLFVLGEDSALKEQEKYIKSWIQTSVMIARQIILKNWKKEGSLSIHEWSMEMARVAAFERMSYKQSGCEPGYTKNGVNI